MPRLKSWESPRRKGRNDKGKGGSARARQLRKQMQMLRQKLKDNSAKPDINNRGELNLSFFFRAYLKSRLAKIYVARSNKDLYLVNKLVNERAFIANIISY
jgi:hypothetical protein